MTSEIFVASIAVGVLAGWFFNFVMKDGGYGLFADLALGLAGSTIAVLICQQIGLVPDAGMAGTIGAAVAGSAALILVQRKVWAVPLVGGAR